MDDHRADKKKQWVIPHIINLLLVMILFMVWAKPSEAASPAEPIKLIFIHHSCGENWLSDHNGGLARALQKNNYFVSDTNYGWGPDGIGDRTDIENWPEWFTGPQARRNTSALYLESGVHSPYRRILTDPGGENRIILFKSCFPNSELYGGPNDAARRGEGLTVANAKAVYLELLKYFATRPDKLFVAITAPPVSNRTHAANARAFNTWLVTPWLKDYPGKNVAVFDFYNVLTGKANHHRIRKGGVEYINNRGGDTLMCPSGPGDDHPSSLGNRKATAEFVPLLNAYYQQWVKTAPQTPPQIPSETASVATDKEVVSQPEPENTESSQPAPARPRILKGDLLDDFESEDREWASFFDHGTQTKVLISRDASTAKNGKQSLRVDYDVAPDSWATCSLINDSPEDWSKYKGIQAYIHAPAAGSQVTVTVHGGRSDALTHFEYTSETTDKSVGGWQKIEIPWDEFRQPAWEGDGSARFDPSKAMGLAFIFNSPAGKNNKGRIWLDDVGFMK